MTIRETLGTTKETQRESDNKAHHTLDPSTRPTLSRRLILRWTLRTRSRVRATVGYKAIETRSTSSEGERFWFDGDLFEFVTEAPSDQETADVRADLNASANLADGGGALEDGDGVASFCETVGGRETAEATANDDDVDWQGGATTLEEVAGWHGGRERKRESFGRNTEIIIVGDG